MRFRPAHRPDIITYRAYADALLSRYEDSEGEEVPAVATDEEEEEDEEDEEGEDEENGVEGMYFCAEPPHSPKPRRIHQSHGPSKGID